MQPVWNEPALTFELTAGGVTRRWLAVSELHIGFESGLARQGAYMKSRTQALADRLLTIAKDRAATCLLILGDVKQRVTGTSPQERRDVPAFFRRLAGFERILITRGNHDAGLGAMLPAKSFPNVEIAPATGVVLDADDRDVAAIHGHAWPRPEVLAADVILVGHTHAAVRIVDESGRATTEWAWARGRIDPSRTRTRYGQTGAPDVIVFPPFNPLLGGAAINRDGLLGPFGKLVDPDGLRLYLLDGRDLGTVDRPASGV